MAVYTNVDDRTLSDFLSRYDVGNAISFKGIAEGVENSNFLLETEKARFILTLYEKRANPDDLPYFLDMMEHLARCGVPSPLPIRDLSGASLQTVAGRPACMISFLSGVSVDTPDIEHCGALGHTLGTMHNKLETFTQVRQNDLSLRGWNDLFERTKNRADEVQKGLAKLIEDELEFLNNNWPDSLPIGPIHADLFPDNILFTGHTVTGVIDFYFACTDMLAYDLAVCINAWCFDKRHIFSPSHAKRLVEMYDIARPLSGPELNALPILCRGAAIRFLLTRLYDWLNPVDGAVVRPKNPLDYLSRLKFHQNTKDAARYVV